MNARIWTVGHSTRSFDEFVRLLEEHRIEILADVRHYPGSQRVPWTAKVALGTALRERGVAYEHLEDLGGYRKPLQGGANRGLRNRSFRGYADFMATAAFREALDHLVSIAADRRVAIMCAEAVPWKCHRSLLSDALLACGVRVTHILSTGKTQDHRLTKFAHIQGGLVTYPDPDKGV